MAKRTGSEVTAEAVDLALKMINFETEKYTLAAFRSARAASIQSPGQTNPALRL